MFQWTIHLLTVLNKSLKDWLCLDLCRSYSPVVNAAQHQLPFGCPRKPDQTSLGFPQLSYICLVPFLSLQELVIRIGLFSRQLLMWSLFTWGSDFGATINLRKDLKYWTFKSFWTSCVLHPFFYDNWCLHYMVVTFVDFASQRLMKCSLLLLKTATGVVFK